MKKLTALLAAAVMSLGIAGGQVSATVVDPYNSELDFANLAEPVLYDQKVHVLISESGRVQDLYKFVPRATGQYNFTYDVLGYTKKDIGAIFFDEDFNKVYMVNNYYELEEGHVYFISAGKSDDSTCEFYFTISNYRGTGNPYKSTWRLIDGYWHYCNDQGVNVASNWEQYRGGWYYFDSEGRMQKGWQLISGKWYYLNPDNGAMFSDWQKIGGKWYYFNKSGVMQTGWQKIGGKWYFFNNSGAMVTGWQQISKKWYYFKNSGEMVTDWQSIGGKWYYFETSGAMKTGWLQLSGKWYYLDTNGAMVTGSKKINGKTYRFGTNGVCQNP